MGGVLNNLFKVDRSITEMVYTSNFLGYGLNTEATLANSKTSLSVAAFFNGVDQISNDIAKLPKAVYIKEGDSRLKDSENPINYLLSKSPNDLMTAFDFWKIIVISSILKGDGFAEIIRNSQTGFEESYIYLDYDDVIVYKKNNKLFYKYKDRIIPGNNMLHFKFFTTNGLRGESVIKYAASQLGINLDAQNYAKDLYKDRGIGYGVIEADMAVKSENKKLIEEGFQKKMASKDKFKVPMLDEGMKYKSIQITPAEAQFLETTKNGVIECCRWLNINPHKVKDFTQSNYSNVYQASIEHVQDSIMPWAIRMEQEVDRKSFSKDTKKYFKMNLAVLLRGDLAAKKDFYTAMVYAGVYTRNEIRALEEMNPINGLDEILQPVNMQALSMANELIKQQLTNGNSSK